MHIFKSALLSSCKAFRYTLHRRWDDRPKLVVLMFNPSTADADVDDQTIQLVSHIASHNGFGGMVVVNLVPIRSPEPADAVEMVRVAGGLPGDLTHPLRTNLAHIQEQLAGAGALLAAWGNLAPPSMAGYIQQLFSEIGGSLQTTAPVYCLGTTKNGNPLHPMARGKLKIPKDAPFIPWTVPFTVSPSSQP